MKKLFALIITFVLASCLFIGGTRQPSFVYAENETSQVEPSSSSSESSSEEELEPIDIDKETNEIISDNARDVIEVIKTVFNQPIVIGGVSVSLGTLVLFIFGKIITNLLDKRNSKYDKKIKELLAQIGVSEQAIDTLKGEIDKLLKVIREMIENTKNLKVKEKLLELYNEKKEIVENKAQETIDLSLKTTQETIEEILNK